MNLPVRKKGKQTRLFIDNEYIGQFYLANLPSFITKVYLVLAKYANADTQKCFPSLSTLSREAGSNKNYVAWAIRALEALHIVSVQRKNNKVSHYSLLDSQVWRSVSSIKVDTYKVVSKVSTSQYQEHQGTSITPDTRNHIRKSYKEISNNSSIKTGGSLNGWQLKKARVVLGYNLTDESIFAVLNRAKEDGVPPYDLYKEDVLRKYSANNEPPSEE